MVEIGVTSNSAPCAHASGELAWFVGKEFRKELSISEIVRFTSWHGKC